MASERNPYRIIRRSAKAIFLAVSIAVALGGAALLVGGLVFVYWVDEGWGAWALTMPFLIVIGIASFIVVVALIGEALNQLARWWQKQEHNWRTEQGHDDHT